MDQFKSWGSKIKITTWTIVTLIIYVVLKIFGSRFNKASVDNIFEVIKGNIGSAPVARPGLLPAGPDPSSGGVIDRVVGMASSMHGKMSGDKKKSKTKTAKKKTKKNKRAVQF